MFGNLLFISVEETRGQKNCTVGTVPGNQVDTNRFRGVRIFDISDLDNPVQLPGVQLCRGSHTHTLVEDPDDPANIYVYDSGTAGICRQANSPAVRTLRSPRTQSLPATRRSPASTSSRCRWRPRRRLRSSASRASPPTRRPARSTDCRTRLRGTQPRPDPPVGQPTGRRLTATPAMTSRRSPTGNSWPAPARATGSCSTSRTRSTRCGLTPYPTSTTRTGTRRRSTTTAPR